MNFDADKLKDFGDTELLCCSKCKEMVNMKILKSSLGIGLFGVSILDYKIDLFTVCPKCGSVFSVDEKVAQTAGKELSNKFNTISEAHLTYQTNVNGNKA